MGQSAFVATRDEEGRIVSAAAAMYVMAMAIVYGYDNCNGYWI